MGKSCLCIQIDFHKQPFYDRHKARFANTLLSPNNVNCETVGDFALYTFLQNITDGKISAKNRDGDADKTKCSLYTNLKNFFGTLPFPLLKTIPSCVSISNTK